MTTEISPVQKGEGPYIVTRLILCKKIIIKGESLELCFFFFLSAGKEGRGDHFNASCPAGETGSLFFCSPYTPATPSQPKPQPHTITPIIVRAIPSTSSQDIPKSKKKILRSWKFLS